MLGRHQESNALHVRRFVPMELYQPAHRHRVFDGIGRESGLPSPSPGAHDSKDCEADSQRNISALQKLKRARSAEQAVDEREEAEQSAAGERAPSPITNGYREHGDGGDDHYA